MTTMPLFRAKAMQAHQTQLFGKIVLIQPLGLKCMAMFAAFIAMVTVGLLFLGSYTKRSSVTGQLVPDMGVLKVYAPQPGVVAVRLVNEGQAVKRGDVLYMINSERQLDNQNEAQAAISRQVVLRRRSLQKELVGIKELHLAELESIKKKIESIKAELASVATQLSNQKMRVDIAEGGVRRAEQLLAQGYVSQDMIQQRLAELVDVRGRLQALQREQISLQQELQVQTSEQARLPLKHLSQMALIERQLAGTEQEWAESEAKRSVSVVAPQSGIATAITTDTGQAVDASRPLVSIVPSGSKLEAHLYAPSRAIGFIRRNDRVILRYQAFPYQKFGHAQGTVVSISKAAVSANELLGYASTSVNNGEALYRITVMPARQTFMAYGQPQQLQPGMLVDAHVLQETRKLYEWILEPLYSLTGNF